MAIRPSDDPSIEIPEGVNNPGTRFMDQEELDAMNAAQQQDDPVFGGALNPDDIVAPESDPMDDPVFGDDSLFTQETADKQSAAKGMVDILDNAPWLNQHGWAGGPPLNRQTAELGLQMASGGAKLIADAASVPAFVSELASLRRDPLKGPRDPLPFDFEHKNPEFTGKDAPPELLNNPVVKYFDKASEALNIKTSKYPNENLSSLFKKNKSAALDYFSLTVMENLPQQIVTAAAAIAGAPEMAALATIGTIAAGGRNREMKKTQPSLKQTTRLLDSSLNGTFEAMFEVLGGTFQIAKFGERAMRDIGLQTYKEALKRTMQVVGLDAVGEGSEEFGTQIAQDSVSNMLKTHETPSGEISSSEMWVRAIEALAVGSVLGGGMGGIQTARQAASRRSIQTKAFAELTPENIRKLSDKDRVALISSLPKRVALLLQNRALTPDEIASLSQEERDAVIQQLPQEIRDKFKTLRIRAQDVERGRLREATSKKTLPKSLDFDKEDFAQDPSVFQFANAKLQLQYEQRANISKEEFDKKAKVIKDKIGIAVGNLPSALQNELLLMPLEQLESAPIEGENSLAATFKDQMFFFAGDPKTKDYKFVAAKRSSEVETLESELQDIQTLYMQSTDAKKEELGNQAKEIRKRIEKLKVDKSSNKIYYHFKTYRQQEAADRYKTEATDEKSRMVSGFVRSGTPIDKWLADQSNDDLFALRSVVDTNDKRGQFFQQSLEAAVKREIALREKQLGQPLRPASQQTPSELLTTEAKAEEADLQATADRIIKGLDAASNAANMPFKGQQDAENYGESIKGDKVKIQTLKDVRDELAEQAKDLKGNKAKQQDYMNVLTKKQLVNEALAKAEEPSYTGKTPAWLLSWVKNYKGDKRSPGLQKLYDHPARKKGLFGLSASQSRAYLENIIKYAEKTSTTTGDAPSQSAIDDAYGALASFEKDDLSAATRLSEKALTRMHTAEAEAARSFLDELDSEESDIADLLDNPAVVAAILSDPSVTQKQKDEILQNRIINPMTRKLEVKVQTAYEQLKDKLGPRGTEVYKGLVAGVVPEEVHARSREDFWKHYNDAKTFLDKAIKQFGESIRVIPKVFVKIRIGDSGWLEGQSVNQGSRPQMRTGTQKVTRTVKVNKSVALGGKRDGSQDVTSPAFLAEQETPEYETTGTSVPHITTREIRVAAKVVRGTTLVDSHIEVDNAKLRDDYRSLKAGKVIESEKVEQFSPDTFNDFPNPEEAYLRYAVLHEQVHLLGGINGEVYDENLAKLLALEIGAQLAKENLGINTPYMDAEIMRIKQVMSGEVKGHRPGLPWVLKASKVYNAAWQDVSGKEVEVKGPSPLKGSEISKMNKDKNIQFISIEEQSQSKAPVQETVGSPEPVVFKDGKWVSANAEETVDPKDEISLDVSAMFDEQQKDLDNDKRSSSAFWGTEEGNKAMASLEKQGYVVDRLKDGSQDNMLYQQVQSLIALYEQLKGMGIPEDEIFESSPQAKQLAKFFAGQDKSVMERIKKGTVQDVMSILPEDLRVMMTAYLKDLKGGWKTERALGWETSGPTDPPKRTTVGFNAHQSRIREYENAFLRMLKAPLGFMHILWGKTPAMQSVVDASGEEDMARVFAGQAGSRQILQNQTARILNLWNDALRRVKRGYIGRQNQASFEAWHAGSDVLLQTMHSILINFQEKVKKNSDGTLDFEQGFLQKRLELIWKSLEEFRVPELYANTVPKIFKTLTGKGLVEPSQAFLDNNFEKLGGRTSRPEMFYWNQLTEQERQAAVFINARITRMRTDLLQAGYMKHSDLIGSVQKGYFPAKWYKGEAESFGQTGSSKKSDATQADRLKKSTDADDLVKRAQKDEGLTVLTSAATSLSAYLYENSRALFNAQLANDMKHIPNPMSPLPEWGGVVIYENDVMATLKANGWKSRKETQANGDEKTFWKRPAGADSNLFPKDEYETKAFMTQVLGYGEFGQWPALESDRGGMPWMPPKIMPEFEHIMGSEYTALKSIEQFVNQANYLSKVLVMYAPSFQLMQIGTAFLVGTLGTVSSAGQLLMTPVKIAQFIKSVVQNDPGAALNPIAQQRQPYDTVALHGKYENRMDMLSEASKYGLSALSVGNVIQQLADYQQNMPWFNSDKTLFGHVLNFLGPLNQFLWGTWIRNMSLNLWTAHTETFMKKGVPEPMAKQMAADLTNQIINMPGRHIMGQEARLFNIMLFAKDFALTMARQVTGSLPFGMSRGGASALLGDNKVGAAVRHLTKSLFWGVQTREEMRMMRPAIASHLAIGMMGYLFFTNILNAVTTSLMSKEKKKILAIENEPGHRGDIFFGYDERGKKKYLRMAPFQEFSTLLQFLPADWSLGIGKGPVQATVARSSTAFRLGAILINNATSNGDKVFIEDGQGDLNDYVQSGYKLLSVTLPDFAKENKDENMTLQDYLLTFALGTQTTKGKAGSDLRGFHGDEGIVDGTDVNPLGQKYFIVDEGEALKIIRVLLPKLQDSQKQLVNVSDKDLQKASADYFKLNPFGAKSYVNAIVKREAPQLSSLKNIQKFAIYNMSDEQRGKVFKERPPTFFETAEAATKKPEMITESITNKLDELKKLIKKGNR